MVGFSIDDKISFATNQTFCLFLDLAMFQFMFKYVCLGYSKRKTCSRRSLFTRM